MKTKTVVVFRRWISGGVIALFPYESHDKYSNCVISYEHQGQHAGADYEGVVSRTSPVNKRDQDIQDLIGELTRIGYDLDIKTRASYVKRIHAKKFSSKNLTSCD